MRYLFIVLLLVPLFWQEAHAAVPDCTTGVTASRTSGKAPLLVFFDATAACTDADTSEPIHDLTYCFNGGDGQGGTYTTAGHHTTNKETFCGSPLWAYVYEAAGTHTMTLTAVDQDGNTDTSTVDVTVTAFTGAETTCISTSGTFTGCPSGAAQETSSDFDASITTCLTTNSDTRCLFRAGESFAAGIQVVLTTPAVHIGSYGASGVGDGKYTVTGDVNLFDPDEDIRITHGSWSPTVDKIFVDFRAEDGASDPTNVLIQSWDTTQTTRVVDGGCNNQTDTSVFPSNLGLFNVNAQDCGNSGDNCIFASIRNLALVDSKFEDATDGEHIIRLQHGDEAFIHNIKASGAAGAKHVITVRGVAWAGANDSMCGGEDQWAEHVFVSDSHIVGDGVTTTREVDRPIEATSAANTSADGSHHRDHIWERNYFTSSGGTVNEFVWASCPGGGGICNNITFRNHLIDLTGVQSGGQAFRATIGIRMKNNSIYSPSGLNTEMIRADVTSCVSVNNLMWEADGASAMYQINECGTSTTNYDSDGGETGVADLNACPFATCPPTTVEHFQIAAGNNCNSADCDTVGTAVDYVCDFNQEDLKETTWPVGAWRDGTATNDCIAGVAAASPGGFFLIVQ